MTSPWSAPARRRFGRPSLKSSRFVPRLGQSGARPPHSKELTHFDEAQLVCHRKLPYIDLRFSESCYSGRLQKLLGYELF